MNEPNLLDGEARPRRERVCSPGSCEGGLDQLSLGDEGWGGVYEDVNRHHEVGETFCSRTMARRG